jgi:hypothetical protein
MGKKQAVKDEIMKSDDDNTINDWHYHFTGIRGGARWHKTVLEVSVGTIRRALDELVRDGKLERYMKYGHCYDEWRYRWTQQYREKEEYKRYWGDSEQI